MKIVLFLLFLVCGGYVPRQTELKGHIENYNGEVVRICLEGNEAHRDTLEVDSLGNFVFCPMEKQGVIYKISIKDHQPWIAVYMAEGDQVEVRLVLTAEKQVTSDFKGDRVTENVYLQAYGEVENTRIWYEPTMRGLSFKAYRTKVEEMESRLTDFLNKIEDADIKTRLAERQYLMFQRQLVAYPWRCLTEQQQESDPDFATYMQSVDVNNPQKVDDDIISAVVNWKMRQEGYDEGDYLLTYLNVLDQLVTNQEIKNHHATEELKGELQYFSGNDLNASVERYNTLCTDDTLKAEINAEYAEYQRVYGNLMPGKTAPDFEIMTPDGKKCHLSDLKGKFLFIDIWATWCSPCRDEIPHMAKLQEYFANDPRIDLISISVDANVNTWKKFIEQEKMTWMQCIVDAKNNRILDKEYRIFGIPHFMLIDPEGRFIAYNFVRPSDPACAKMIEKIIAQ